MTEPTTLVRGTWVPSLLWRRKPEVAASALAKLQVTDVWLCLNDNSDRINCPKWHVFGDSVLRPQKDGKGLITVGRAGMAQRAKARARVVAGAEAFRAAGIQVHGMTWIRPEAAFIEPMIEDLAPIVDEAGLASIQFDAEEPWVLTKGDHNAAALMIHEGSLGPLSVTCIVSRMGHHTIESLASLPSVTHVMPQAYATKRSVELGHARPVKVQEMAGNLWTKSPMRLAGKAQIMGLAAYGQAGIPNHTQAKAIASQFKAALAQPDVEGTCYWSARSLLGAAGPIIAATW